MTQAKTATSSKPSSQASSQTGAAADEALETAPAPECIYADPPYAGTTGYDALPPNDHRQFWPYCQEWARRGTRVFVSEYDCPVGSDIVWEKSLRVTTAGGKHNKSALERLFRVHAPSVVRCA